MFVETLKLINMIKIDKNVPITKKAGNGTQYPWDKMKEGDSFLIENLEEKKRTSILTSGRLYLKYHGYGGEFKIISRKEGSGYRFWLTKID